MLLPVALLLAASCGDDVVDAADPWSAEEERAAAMKRLAAMDAAFANEPRDEAWAARLEEKLNGVVVRKAYRGSHFIGMRCKRTACRVEAAHEPAAPAPISEHSFERFGVALADELMDYYEQRHACEAKVSTRDTLSLGGCTTTYFFRRGYQQESAIVAAVGNY